MAHAISCHLLSVGPAETAATGWRPRSLSVSVVRGYATLFHHLNSHTLQPPRHLLAAPSSAAARYAHRIATNITVRSHARVCPTPADPSQLRVVATLLSTLARIAASLARHRLENPTVKQETSDLPAKPPFLYIQHILAPPSLQPLLSMCQ